MTVRYFTRWIRPIDLLTAILVAVNLVAITLVAVVGLLTVTFLTDYPRVPRMGIETI